LENAKAAIRKVIAQHEETITTLQAAIDVSTDDAAQEQDAKDAVVAKFDSRLKRFADAKAQLQADQDAAKAKKEEAERQLADTTSKGEEQIAKLLATLKASVDSLKEERTKTEADRTKQIDTNAATMQNLLNSQNEAVNEMTAAIERLKGQKNTAREILQNLKAKNLEAASTGKA
jgi:chromosome segregation ATPase